MAAKKLPETDIGKEKLIWFFYDSILVVLNGQSEMRVF